MAIIDFKTNKKLSAREIKARVMEATGWSDEKYRKEYDILRNKTRNYETVTGSKMKIKVNELLYTQTASKRKYGGAYEPSRLLRAIQATPSLSTGTVKRKGVSAQTTAKLESEILGEFRGFTSKSAEGKRIKQLYEEAKSGRLEAEITQLREKYENATKEAEEKGKVGKRAKAKIEKLKERIETAERDLEEAPKSIAELKQQLTSSAKSLKEYQKNKRGEWRKMNPDAPADYTVGTP